MMDPTHRNDSGQCPINKPSPPSGPAYDFEKEDTPEPMSHGEKERLALNIQRLQSDKLAEVINIIQLNEPALSRTDPNEIEVDFDRLKISTLRKLESYVASCNKRVGRQRDRDVKRRHRDHESDSETSDESPSRSPIRVPRQRREERILQDGSRHVNGSNDGPQLGSPYQVRQEKDEIKPMSYKEKHQLSLDIIKLSSDQIGKVVEIIQLNEPPPPHDSNPEELDVDFEALKQSTLRQLQSFVSSCLTGAKQTD